MSKSNSPTGRMSNNKPDFQRLPRKRTEEADRIIKAFEVETPKPKFVSPDYAELERKVLKADGQS